MEFAYVTFVTQDEPYMSLMKHTIRSVLTFSKYPIIVYCVNFTTPPQFDTHERVHIRRVSGTMPCVFVWKPYIICDSIEKGLEKGMYIEADDIITPRADILKDYTRETYPVCPIHEKDNDIPLWYMRKVGAIRKTQPYVHGHVLFRKTNIAFLREWLSTCQYMMKDMVAYDESVLNCLYWKHRVHNHYMGRVDPSEPDAFYRHSPEERGLVCMYHGCKDPVKQEKLLDDLIEWYTPTCSDASSCQSSQLQTTPSLPCSPPCEDAGPSSQTQTCDG